MILEYIVLKFVALRREQTMADLVMNYTVNPLWMFMKRTGTAFIKAQEAAGRAKAANHLANMGYYEEAKKIMLQEKS